MTKTKSAHVCTECGTPHPKWSGQCTTCGGWNTLVEELLERTTPAASPSVGVGRLADVTAGDEAGGQPTGLAEFDRVLGGGLVPGSVTLLGGEPGIGKSTLVTQMLGWWPGPCLYVSAEEGPHQVRRRAARLSLDIADVWITAAQTTDQIVAAIDEAAPSLIVVDSIQTVADPSLSSPPGSVGPVRQCAHLLVNEAKQRNVAVVVIGHVTKDGTIAGPRVLEHVVDTVLSFEGDRHHALRTLRAMKHRYGSTNEVGLFEMTAQGLMGVSDAARLFVGDTSSRTPGAVVAATIDGHRPLLVEAQALTVQVHPPMTARRTASGVDSGRLALILAVLDRHCGHRSNILDVYASTVGGLRITEPGLDLAVAVALASSMVHHAVDPHVAVFGELGLGGEVRHVAQPRRRIDEAHRLGFTTVIAPPHSIGAEPIPPEMTVHEVPHLFEALLGLDLVPGRRDS